MNVVLNDINNVIVFHKILHHFKGYSLIMIDSAEVVEAFAVSKRENIVSACSTKIKFSNIDRV